MAEWMIPVLMLVGFGGNILLVAYNIVVTQTIMKNDIKHLEATIVGYKIDNTREHDTIQSMITTILQKVIDAGK